MTNRGEDSKLALEAFDEMITQAYFKCCLSGFVAGVIVGMCAAIMLTVSINK